tara:strand:+ start:412 stop:801 length:390 start_codon:yes stop_codon:yes gene_type:complete
MGILDFLKGKKRQEENDIEDLLSMLSKGNMYGIGCDTDQIPGTIGEFGLDLNNPIPVSSIPAAYKYLENLRFADNMKVKFERTGSYGSEYVKYPIDGYSIFHPDGRRICMLFISPYHKVDSKLKPKGFK